MNDVILSCVHIVDTTGSRVVSKLLAVDTMHGGPNSKFEILRIYFTATSSG